jgi:hypothetical protein
MIVMRRPGISGMSPDEESIDSMSFAQFLKSMISSSRITR